SVSLLDHKPRPTLSPYTTLFRSSRACTTPPWWPARARRARKAPRKNKFGQPAVVRICKELILLCKINNPPHRQSRRIRTQVRGADRKSTRLNSSHVSISYAVFCL